MRLAESSPLASALPSAGTALLAAFYLVLILGLFQAFGPAGATIGVGAGGMLAVAASQIADAIREVRGRG